MKRIRNPLHRVWVNMFRNCRSNKYYVGVSVCSEWRDRSTFEEWAYANGYAKGLVLTRKDKSGDFSPDNCVFVTMQKFNDMRRCVKRLPDGRSTRDIIGPQASRAKQKRTFRRLFMAGWDVVSARIAPPLYKGAAPIPRPQRIRRCAI